MRAPRVGLLLCALVALAAGATLAQSGLPGRAPEPRTMREFWPIFLAFAVAWSAIAGFVVVVGRRIARIARSVEAPGPDR